MTELEDTLEKRGEVYGPFSTHAHTAQEIKATIRKRLAYNESFKAMEPVEQSAVLEGLDMIAHKIGRLCNGDPSHEDGWVDIAGYATITNKVLRGKL